MTTFQFLLATPDGHRHVQHFDALGFLALTDQWQRKWFTFDGLLGCHVYARQHGTDLQVGIRFSNGCTRANGQGFQGRLYYNALGFSVDGVQIALAQGGGHVFPPRGILERRFTISAGTVQRGWSHADVQIPNPAPPFGPAGELLPPVDRARYAHVFGSMLQPLRHAIRSGLPCTLYPWGTNGPAPAIDLRSGAFGPFHPDGFPDAGAPAGYGIDLAFGWEQCVEALDFAAMHHECIMDRNPVAAYDLDTGRQIHCEDWASNYLAHGQLLMGEPYPQTQKLELPAFMQGTYQNFHYGNANHGTSNYQAALEGYQPDNTEHVVRAMRRACALVGWSGDPMAADDLTALFEYHRTLFYGDRLDDKTHPDYPGQWVPQSLSKLAYQVALNPGHGAAILRDFGWMAMLGAWANAPVAWSDKMVDTYLAMCDKFGIPQRYGDPAYMPAGWSGTQHFHSAIIHNGMWVLAKYAKWRTDDVRVTIDRWQQHVLENRAMPFAQRADTVGVWGPPKWILTAGPTGEVPELSTANTEGGGFQEHVLAALGRQAQGAPNPAAALTAGLGIGVPCSTLADKLAQMRAQTGDLGQTAHYWGALEEAVT